MSARFSVPSLVIAIGVLCVTSLEAQWLTQTNHLKAGWNAVFLHVDPSHGTIEEILPPAGQGHPIEEIWYWRTARPTGQFVESPTIPSGSGDQWIKWQEGLPATSPLSRLVGNGAYLVKVAAGTPAYAWRVKGRPVTPTYQWTLSGLNFIGFPTPETTPPSFEVFTAPVPALAQNGDFYRYVGGDLGPANPVAVSNPRSVSVARDQAYWVRAGETYSEYYGPFQIVHSDTAGLRFGDSTGQTRFRLRNVAPRVMTVTMEQVASEPAPAGQPALVGAPTLLLRGEINTTDLTFGYSELSAGPRQWTLQPAGQPGSEVEVIIGLDRSTMTGPPGSDYGAVLRFTDSLGLIRVDMGVSAVSSSPAGLWVGEATVNYVGHYLKPFARATNQVDFVNLLDRLGLEQDVDGFRYEWDEGTGRVLVFGGPDNKTGSYLLDGPIKVDSGDVARPFPLRLILHNDGTTSRLLQKVYHGVGLDSTEVVATRENLLSASDLASARRISAVHLPTSSANVPWACVGEMRPSGNLVATVNLAYDDHAANPFLHTYHPDHDNLDAQFGTVLDQGVESYGVTRRITLNFTPPTDDFNGLTRGSRTLGGEFAEVITFRSRGEQTREYHVLGGFTIGRISPVAELTTQ